MAVLINAYAAIQSPHRRVPSCAVGDHVVAMTSNDLEEDAAVGDLLVGMCYETSGVQEFGYWANDNAVRFHDAMIEVTATISAGSREPFYEYLDSDPTQATFGPQSCSRLATDFASWFDDVRPRLVAIDEMFGGFYEHLGSAYAHARDGGLVLFA